MSKTPHLYIYDSSSKFIGNSNYRSKFSTEMDKITELIQPKKLKKREPSCMQISVRDEKLSDSWLGSN
jgi:hypothetical protein